MTSAISTTSDSSIYSSSGYAYSGKMYEYPIREINYDELFKQVSDSALPIISKNDWEKISQMLDSSDIELVKVGFEYLQGYRFPPGVMNLLLINKAINTLLKNIYDL